MRESALPMADEMEKLLSELVTSSKELSTRQDAAVAEIMSSTERIGLGVGIAAVLILIGSAAYGALAIAKPLRKMAHVLTALTKDHTVEVPYITRGDEVGDNAPAAQTFKEGIIRMEQMEAEQVAAEKISAEERRVAMQKLTDDFEAAIGGIVKAAVAGDFSRRVSLEGKNGFILNLGGAMNALCENVGHAWRICANARRAGGGRLHASASLPTTRASSATLKDDANAMADRIGIDHLRHQVGRTRGVQRGGRDLDQHDRSVAANRGAGREPRSRPPPRWRRCPRP